MKHILLLAAALLFSAAAYSSPKPPDEALRSLDAQAVAACLMCSDEWKRELEACKSQPAGEARDFCRENAQRNAKECAKEKVGLCNLDLLMEAPEKSEPAQSNYKLGL